MPKVDEESKGPRPGSALPDDQVWWDRGYGVEGYGHAVACLGCGAMVPTGSLLRGDAYWQIHDRWHEAVDRAH